MRRLTIIIVLSALAVGCGKQEPPRQPAAALQNQQTVPVQYSEFQHGFMSIVADYAKRYDAAENELQKSALFTERIKQFRKLKGKPEHIKDWIGVLKQMGTNGDGKAYLTISLSPNLLTVSTWNNSFSDISDHTLIPQKSPIYTKLAQMKEGNVVMFSGKLLRTTNITEKGKMTEPDFLFAFTNIEKIGERAD